MHTGAEYSIEHQYRWAAIMIRRKSCSETRWLLSPGTAWGSGANTLNVYTVKRTRQGSS
jgi:hypothetical protein